MLLLEADRLSYAYLLDDEETGGVTMMKSSAKRNNKHSRVRFNRGFTAGYQQGLRIGEERGHSLFDGTSIIIPTYNKAGLLRQCIESIEQYTQVPYELIIIDNASTDGTREYLRSLGRKVRVSYESFNRGFAGAVNRGLMMAHGTTIVLLNNDIIVTHQWLDNMLHCLRSDDSIGIVGPSTNYIGGEQQVAVPYEAIADMQQYARENNVSNPTRWQRTDRLVGFCMLFRQSLLRSTGYFDEGYELGNFEDDDFIVRVRLQNKALVIARDSFIHHLGSQSMKELGHQYAAVHDRNENFYMQKWSNPMELIQQVRQIEHLLIKPGSAWTIQDMYPSHMIVKGRSPLLYWVEHGVKHPFYPVGFDQVAMTLMSHLELRQWPTGPEVSWDHVQAALSGTEQTGSIIEAEDGTLYQLGTDVLRRLTNGYTAERWNLHLRPRARWSARQLRKYTEGFPIIAPPLLQNTEL